MPSHGRPKRALAVLLVAATGAGVAVPAAHAATHGSTPAPVATHGLIDDLLGSLPGPVSTLPLSNLTTLLTQAAADPAAALPLIVSQVSPAQINALLGNTGALGQIVDGLATTVTALLSGQPNASQVDALIAQVNALLAGGLPTDPAQVQDLTKVISGLPALLNVPGLDTSGLQTLSATIAGLLGADGGSLPGTGGSGGGTTGTGTAGTSGLTTSLASLLSGLPSLPAGSSSKTPATGTTTGSAGGGDDATTGSRFRARVTMVKVARGNRSFRVRVACPASAPACVVHLKLSGGGATTKGRFLGLEAGTAQTVTLKLPAAAAKRLTKRGGKVKATAATVGSTLGASTRRAHAKRA